MKPFTTIIKLDYLQRTRSYSFLITLCASLAIAYTFVPEPNANYSTIRIADYVGVYNSAWFGYVTAIMTSAFLSLIGFYLINSSIKTDIDNRVGHIIAATRISNFSYLLSKVISNFLVLLTIVGTVFGMSILLFFLYNDGFSFYLIQFIKPYVLITCPAMFIVAVIAVVFEVVFEKYTILQNILFFFLFSLLALFSPKNENQYALDLFGNKTVLHQMENEVRTITNSDQTTKLSIGYVLGNVKKANTFEFNGVDFSTSFIISRFVWILIGIGIIVGITPLFHRFKRKENNNTKETAVVQKRLRIKEVLLSVLPKTNENYGVLPLLRTEFLLLFRKGKKWLWIINIIGMVLLSILPIKVAHQMVLPILWFIQVHRISDITTREITNNVHYFTFTSYKPIARLLVSKISSAIILLLCLATPLLLRVGLLSNFSLVIAIVLGASFIVMTAALLGVLFKGKKLFEVLFFMITYANINGILFLDYFGGFEHTNFYIIRLATLVMLLGCSSFLLRRYQLKK
ncbi:hypothetical protein [Aquimarina sp. AU474]|uniref:hypothetical protein n=1 Tax=Aquimarina sp. AU474 TaxID=2108529 RepID=UPI000D69F3CB|nr:hypothetical protein [Aquimarina sp. AU474]